VASQKGVLWQAEIPGLGFSSPVIVNRRLYLTTAVAEKPVRYDRRSDSGNDQVSHQWQVLAVDATSGKILWNQTAHQGVPRIRRHGKASHANSTSAADGTRVAAFFGSEGLYVYSAAGKLLWKKDLGVLTVGLKNDLSSEWAFSSSPVLYRNMVIVQCDTNREDFVAAFDVASGKELWRSTREEYPAWSTPLVVETPKGVQVVTTSPRFTRGLDIATGKEVWRFADETEVKTPAPITAHGLIFISGGYPTGRNFFALKMDGTLAWRNEKGGPYVPTPIVYGDYLYVAGDAGVVGCYEARTGKEVYRERIGPGVAFSASPVAGDGKLYLASEEGDMYILRAGPKLEVLGKRPFGEGLMATPAIADGVIYVRSLAKLYAIGARA
jgi:outer membrane protein assembly factor BamB